MICVLDNYFLDPRPKVPIFPKDTKLEPRCINPTRREMQEPVCRNFYMELLRWPSRWIPKDLFWGL